MMIETDILVVGSGVAGLSFAVQTALKRPDLSVAVLTKSQTDNCNTYYAQGGIAVVTPHSGDSFEQHINDTILSGKGLSDRSIVGQVVRSAPERIRELVDYGVNFTLTESGAFDLSLEGGHSAPRIVHAFDNTGEHVLHALLRVARRYTNIAFYDHRFCIDVLKTGTGRAAGISALNIKTHTVEYFKGKAVVLATGGSGQVYQYTTNPSAATGDGLVMGIRTGAESDHLNYVQFHPTALYEPGNPQLSLLTEAIRGFGGHIVNKDGRRFVFDSDPRGELATRDIVSQAIFQELKESGAPCAYLDCRHIKEDAFRMKFPTIAANLNRKGLEASADLIPIIPAAHYQCGGLKVNKYGQTNIDGLLAIGECAETGLHGANRLASNSLLEALVFAHDAAAYLTSIWGSLPKSGTVACPAYKITDEQGEHREPLKEVKRIMSNHATIAADQTGLNTAKATLDQLYERMIAKETSPRQVSEGSLTLFNLLTNAREIVAAKLEYAANSKEACVR